MTDQQFKEIKAALETSNTILFAGFMAILQSMNPDMDEQEARDAIVANLTRSLAEVRDIPDSTSGE